MRSVTSQNQWRDIDAGRGLGQDAGIDIFGAFSTASLEHNMRHTDDQILSGYYKHQQTNADEDFWAWEEVNELCHDLASGLRITGKLIESAPTDWSLSCIGAGPLEELVRRFELPAVTHIAEIAETSEQMQRAILSVNVDDDSPALSAWEVLLRKHHEGNAL